MGSSWPLGLPFVFLFLLGLCPCSRSDLDGPDCVKGCWDHLPRLGFGAREDLGELGSGMVSESVSCLLDLPLLQGFQSAEYEAESLIFSLRFCSFGLQRMGDLATCSLHGRRSPRLLHLPHAHDLQHSSSQLSLAGDR